MKVWNTASLLLGTVLGSWASHGATPQECGLIRIHAINFDVDTRSNLSAIAIRERQEKVFSTKDPQEIESIMSLLQKKMEGPAIKDSASEMDARWVADCYRSDGSVTSFVASYLELRNPPSKKTVAIDESFRKFFTLDADFAKRLVKTGGKK